MRTLSLHAWFLFSALSAYPEKLPRYRPDSLLLKFDKSKPYYVDSPIPAKEKPFTKDFREVHLSGVNFPASAPLIVFPDAYDNPATPYEALANFYFVVKTRDIGKVVALHDSASRNYMDSSLHVERLSSFFFQSNSSVKKIEILDVFESPGMVLVFGNSISNTKVPAFWYLIKENGVYKKKSGVIDLGYFVNLGWFLQKGDGSFVIKK